MKRVLVSGVLLVAGVGIVLVQPSRVLAQATQPASPSLPKVIERRCFIAAGIDRVWNALHDKKVVADWFPFPLMQGELKAGEKLLYGSDGQTQLECEILAVQEKKMLSTTFHILQSEQLAAEPPTRVTYHLRTWGPTTELHIVHDQLEASPLAARSSGSIWDNILSRLKTLLETGVPLHFSYEDVQKSKIMDDPDEKQPVNLSDRYNPLAFVREITLYVKDMKQARPWYEEAFALPLSGFSLDWIRLSMAVPSITVKEARDASVEEPGKVMLSFYAPDVLSLYQRLQKQGVKMVQPLRETRYTREFTFVNPEGVRFFVRGPLDPPPGFRPEPATQPAAGQP